MRKHSIHLTRPHLVFVTGIVLALAACSRDSRSERTADSNSGLGLAAATRSTPAGFARGGPEAKALSATAVDEAIAAAPAASPAPAANQSAPTLDVGAPLPPASDPEGAMLVRHGEASIEVRHVDDAVAKMRQAAQQFGGFVANTALRNGKDEQPSASLEIRVPTAQFDALLGALRTLGKVETVTASAEDVGEEYVDLGARAANARRVEARLVEMLATRTGKLSDVLTVEQELARVRQEIERHDARLRWLERRAALSSLNVTLHQHLAIIDRPSPGPIVEAIGLAWERTLNVIAWCIASLGIIVPLGVLVGLGWVLLRRAPWPRYRPE
jgi:hypothetical protein